MCINSGKKGRNLLVKLRSRNLKNGLKFSVLFFLEKGAYLPHLGAAKFKILRLSGALAPDPHQGSVLILGGGG